MRLLHTMIRVGDLDESIRFYTEQLGMSLRSRKDYPGGRFTLAFLRDAGGGHEIELTHNWDRKDYDHGDAFGHLAFAVEDIVSVCERMRSAGVPITREPGPMKHGSTVIAFVRDPDGYAIELIERKEP